MNRREFVKRFCTRPGLSGRSASLDAADLVRQLGRAPRGDFFTVCRCACGAPAVIKTPPRLPDKTPFPTLYYLTLPRAVLAASRLESVGFMAGLNQRLKQDEDLARGYARAHQAYISQREAVEAVPEIAAVSAGGMPERVKCLHALFAHSLALGFGANPVGDLALLASDWSLVSCEC